MKIIKTVLAALVLCLVGTAFAPAARADDYNLKTIVTFNEPFEVPGQVLPAGTYTIKLMNSRSNRNIVQIFNADGTHLITTVLAINNYRLTPTGKTVITFSERPGDRPEALKAWFYPGNTWGQQFVYPKHRAIELALAEKEPVPALTVDELPADLNEAPIVAETPEQNEVPVTAAIQTAPLAAENTSPAPLAEQAQPSADAKQLPKTASELPLIALLGMASLGFAFVLKRIAG